jgi:hypothetical protein
MTITEPEVRAGGSGQDCEEVRVALTGHLYTAPVGTEMPTDTQTEPPDPWVDLGYLTEDGVSMGVDTNKEDFTPWQSTSPCRSVVTEQTNTWTFSLMQRNADTLRLAFGGGTVAAGTLEGEWIYRPPSMGLAEAAFILDVEDGVIKDRWCAYRGNPALSGDVSFTKSDPTAFEIEVTLLDSVDGRWQLIGNDPHVTPDTTLLAATGGGGGGEAEPAPAYEPEPI